MILILACLCASPVLDAPHYTPKDAVRSEWNRQPLSFPAENLAKLPPRDRAQLETSLARIGAPGAPELLPPELAHPTKELWEGLARKAKTPQERFTALFFLNRFKAADALVALDGLAVDDAKTWPKHLHLEAQVATARINGAEVQPALQAFLDGLKKAGKIDPVRAQAAQLRLVMAGREKTLLPPVEATPRAILSMMDAWNQTPWPARKDKHIMLWRLAASSVVPPEPGTKKKPTPFTEIGLAPTFLRSDALKWALWSRIWDGLPDTKDLSSIDWPAGGPHPIPVTIETHWASKFPLLLSEEFRNSFLSQSLEATDPTMTSAMLPAIRVASSQHADLLRTRLLTDPSSVARAAAIDDLPSAPADLDALAKRCFDDSDLESALELFPALDRWKLSSEQQKAVLTPFLQHPDWGWRYQAWVQLRKTDPAAPWPATPAERPMDKALLAEATKLAERGKPVRMRITFSGRRTVTLKLDPTVAPMNVANLVLLAKRRFFDGHRVPRVVPDFVVQMGSPLDTMDGGPGYSVRCEDSLNWYGPGSVGMALAGKDTGGCQFFITTNATPHLTGKYTRLGEVENLDHDLKILDDLELGAKIESVRVIE
ncbi:MAG TPA: peptidylprolyl isomerase [Holophagaceae bacterium]|jgi:cyclophilin family peptidyl-prolyl cis-trans isomerase|nr:peptidylprolyl isomerase [Holophagaceae bacterium]